MRLRALSLFLLGLAPVRLSHAQAATWRTVEQGASWYAAVIDQPVGNRLSLWFDGQWRRTGLGAAPQQLLLRPGIQLSLAPSVRVAGGYAWIATAPYGEAPSRTPTREHRVWQQLTLSQRLRHVSVTHRYRWEQRWLTLLQEGLSEKASYQQRMRYMLRVSGEPRGVRLGNHALTMFVWNEFLLPVGHDAATLRLSQNRLGLGLGVPLTARQRAEVGYMNLWNGLPSRRVNEVNHTVTLTWIWSGRR